MMKRTAKDHICQMFQLPKHQIIYQDYYCAFKANIFHYGRLFVSENHILFFSSQFAQNFKIKIKFDQLKNVQEISPKGIEFQTLQKKFVFHSFVKRSHTIKLVNGIWKGQSSQFLTPNQQEQKEQDQFMQGDLEINFFKPENNDQKWELVNVVFPCSVNQFYQLFLSKQSRYGIKKHFQAKQAQKIQVGEWKEIEQIGGKTRQVQGSIRIKGVPFRNYAPMHKTQNLQMQQKQNILISKLVYKSLTRLQQIPFCSCFQVQQQWTVTQHPQFQKKSVLIIRAWIVWAKSTYMKGKIISRTLQDLKDDYQLWVNNVKKILQSSKSGRKNSNQIQFQKQQGFNFEVKQIKKQKYNGKMIQLQILVVMICLLFSLNVFYFIYLSAKIQNLQQSIQQLKK